jgi:hypothetical protein
MISELSGATKPMAPPHAGAVASLLAVSTLVTLGCHRENPYPVYPDMSAKQAQLFAESELGTAYPFEDLAPGTGRVAQPGRRLTVRLDAAFEDGTPPTSGEAQFLFPPLAGPRSVQGYYDSGSMPDGVAVALMGMRVGGVRRVTLSASRDGDRDRKVSDAKTHRSTIALPSGRNIRVKVTLLEVCRPHFTIIESPTIIDVGTRRDLHVGPCD